MTLIDHERRSSPYFAFFAEFDSLQADYVIVVEDRPVMSIKYCFFLPRCMKCRRGLAMRILSVGLSVCLSVCHTRDP